MILFDIALPLTFAVALRSVTCWSRETLKARRGGGCGAFAVKTKQMLFASKKKAKTILQRHIKHLDSSSSACHRSALHQ